MSIEKSAQVEIYEDLYRNFDTPLSRQIRTEAYGKDIGQHSWVAPEEPEKNIPRLNLARTSRLLDLGCGPCAPRTFVVETVRCHTTGIDLSAHSLHGHTQVAPPGFNERALEAAGFRLIATVIELSRRGALARMSYPGEQVSACR